MTPPIVLPYPPSVNHIWRMVNGRMLLSAEGRKYKQRVQWACLGLGLKAASGPVCVSLAVYRPQRRGDLDNALKAVLDALRGVCFEDDSQVEQIMAIRLDDKSNPRVEVRVEPMSGKGGV